MGSDGVSTSQVPAFGLGGALIGALILLGVALSLRRRTRGRSDRVIWSVVAGLVGLAALLVTVFAEGMQHYGGSTSIDKGVSASTCATWWEEIGLPSGVKALPGDFSDTCRHDAVAAIGPGLLWSLLIGVLVGLLVLGLQWVGGARRARRTAVPRTPDSRTGAG